MNKAVYTKLYTDEIGESHFEQLEIDLVPTDFAPPAAPLNIGRFLPASSTVWVGAPSRWAGEAPHPSPQRQVFVTVSGEYEVTASDGEKRRFPPGSVLLLEDVSGKGHTTRITDEAGGLVFAVVLA